VNIEMLRFLVELSDGGNGANVVAFAERFPITQKTKEELDKLRLLGFITPVYGDDKLAAIIVQPKAHNYFL